MRKVLVFQFDFWKENIIPECPKFVFSISRSGSLLMAHYRLNHIKKKTTKKHPDEIRIGGDVDRFIDFLSDTLAHDSPQHPM